MTCLNCNAINSFKARSCRKCKGNPRKAGRGNGSHNETSPMGHSGITKNKRAWESKRACRIRRGEVKPL